MIFPDSLKKKKKQPKRTLKTLDLWLQDQDVKMLKSASGMNLLSTGELGAWNMGQSFTTD